jgi:uncharacterized coiled-coil protein SlyX
MSDRIVELEVRIAYQDKLIADLDEVVRDFAGRVQALERDLAELKRTLGNEPSPVGPQDEREGVGAEHCLRVAAHELVSGKL